MAVTIRLRRSGAKKKPFFRLVVTDSRMPRDGRFLENLGSYNPVPSPALIRVKEDKVYAWLKKGATLSEKVQVIFRKIGLLRKWELLKAGQDTSGINLATALPEKTKRKRVKKKVAKAQSAEKAQETKTETKTD